jgi:ATP-binding cassette, subfamily B, heavy metal transporter
MAAIEVSDKQFIDFRYNFKVYFGFLKKYKWGCFFLIGLVFLMSCLDLGFSYALMLMVNASTKALHSSAAPADMARSLGPILAAFVAIPFIRGFSRWKYLGSINQLESHLIADIKRYYFDHILSLSHGFHSSHKTGSLISRLVRGSGAVETMTDVFIFQFIPILFQLVMVSAAIFHFTWQVGLVVLATVVVYMGFSLYFTGKQQKAHALYNNISDLEKANISDVFTNIESIKYFAKERDIQGRFFDLSEKTRELQKDFWDRFMTLEGGQNFIVGMGTFFLVVLSLQGVQTGSLNIGQFVFVFSYFGILVQSLSGFVMGIRNMNRSIEDFEDLFQYGKIGNEIQDHPEAKPLELTQGAVEFEDVAFTYRKRPILSGFSLRVPPHKRVAVVGPSGAGKTTLIRLLYRFYDVERGDIRLDGQSVRQVTQTSLRDSISMVPQECILFDDTIYNNIAFSNPGASRKKVFKAIRYAQLEKFIGGLPSKENTIVGERGVKLSGGEKQRVSIARALLADKKILVLDEATSSLDSETEHEIQKGLKDLMRGRTCILIAHRLSTIMSADIIVVLDKGKVVQQGSHRKLIRKPGLYRKLWNLQKGGYIE